MGEGLPGKQEESRSAGEDTEMKGHEEGGNQGGEEWVQQSL